MTSAIWSPSRGVGPWDSCESFVRGVDLVQKKQSLTQIGIRTSADCLPSIRSWQTQFRKEIWSGKQIYFSVYEMPCDFDTACRPFALARCLQCLSLTILGIIHCWWKISSSSGFHERTLSFCQGFTSMAGSLLNLPHMGQSMVSSALLILGRHLMLTWDSNQ